MYLLPMTYMACFHIKP